MSIDLRPDDRLEERLRTACHAVIPHLTDDINDTGAGFDQDLDDDWTMTTVGRFPTSARSVGRGRLVGVAAAVLLVAGVAGVRATVSRPAPDSTGVGSPSESAPSEPVPPVGVASTVLAESTGSSVPCMDADCTPIDRLSVVAGAADFYVGPESLGTAVVQRELLDQVGLVRCAELTADGSACQRIEGLAGVGLVSYPTTVAAPATVPGAQPPATIEIEVGTTYTEISPAAYAASWGVSGAGRSPTVPVAVRGHDGVQYDYGDREYVVWQEQFGVLVWVAVPTEMADQLLEIAEGVRRLDGPPTIPHVVVVTPLAQTWDANDNNADGLVYARVGGKLQVGIDYLDGSSPVVARQNPGTDEQLIVGGNAPAQATQVRITVDGYVPVIVDTVAFAGAPEARFFKATVPGGVGEILFAWLAADGTELGTDVSEVFQGDVAVAATIAVTGG